VLAGSSGWRMRSPTAMILRSRHSFLMNRTIRSANALQFGARGGQRITSMPDAFKMFRNASPNFLSRSRIRNRFVCRNTSKQSVSFLATCYLNSASCTRMNVAEIRA